MIELSEGYLLISDLDDTLLGDDPRLDLFVKGLEQLPPIAFAYASGRFFESIVESIDQTALPKPEAIVGGVGTEIRRYPEGEKVEAWPETAEEAWSPERVRQVMQGVPGVQPQPEASQSPHKVSFFYYDASEDDLKSLLDKLRRAGVRADYIYSSSRDLDIVPKGVNKGTAAAYLAEVSTIPKDRIFVSGNSANDSALFDHGFRGIVVNNAHEELKKYAASRDGYLAGESYAAGVLEGLRHYILNVRA